MERLNPKTLRETLDLRHWLVRCNQAGVPNVPVCICPTATRILDFIHPKAGSKTVKELGTINQWTMAQVRVTVDPWKKVAWRWSICDPASVKTAIACSGLPPSPVDTLGDTRFQLFLADASAAGIENITTVVRPWLPVAVEADYPVEFRVIVATDRSAAITSRSPQPPLSSSYAQEAAAMGRKLREFVDPEVGFFADFVVTEDSRVLFNAGGPPPSLKFDPDSLPYNEQKYT